MFCFYKFTNSPLEFTTFLEIIVKGSNKDISRPKPAPTNKHRHFGLNMLVCRVKYNAHRTRKEYRNIQDSELTVHIFMSFPGQYMCYATNEWGTATSNSVFVRSAILNNFKEQPPITKTVEEGKPFRLPCEAPDGWPKPNIYWMIQVSSCF